MGFIIERGDALTTGDPVLMHGVNCRGVMGAGIAAPIKRLYPHNYEVYSRACIDGTLTPGDILPVFDNGVWVVNLASQYDPGRDARLDALLKGLLTLREGVEKMSPAPTITTPLIGAGIGGLDAQKCVDAMREVFEPSTATLRLVLRPGEHEGVI